jgi:hypothetical protein
MTSTSKRLVTHACRDVSRTLHASESIWNASYLTMWLGETVNYVTWWNYVNYMIWWIRQTYVKLCIWIYIFLVMFVHLRRCWYDYKNAYLTWLLNYDLTCYGLNWRYYLNDASILGIMSMHICDTWILECYFCAYILLCGILPNRPLDIWLTASPFVKME